MQVTDRPILLSEEGCFCVLGLQRSPLTFSTEAGLPSSLLASPRSARTPVPEAQLRERSVFISEMGKTHFPSPFHSFSPPFPQLASEVDCLWAEGKCGCPQGAALGSSSFSESPEPQRPLSRGNRFTGCPLPLRKHCQQPWS